MQLMRKKIVVTKPMIVVVVIVVVVQKVTNQVKKIKVKRAIMKKVKMAIVITAKAVLMKISLSHQALLT